MTLRQTVAEIDKANRDIVRMGAYVEAQAYYDKETGLWNRNKLEEDLNNAESTRQSQTVLLIEVPDVPHGLDTEHRMGMRIELMKQALAILR